MTRKAINAPELAAAGPYSHAVDSDGLLFLSGQTPLDSKTGKILSKGIAAQTRPCFEHLFTVLKTYGLTHDDVQKVNVYLANMDDFTAVDAVYEQQFTKPHPSPHHSRSHQSA